MLLFVEKESEKVMKYITINRYLPTPLYAQLKASILQALDQKILVAGDKLPTEEEICASFGVSRPVVRQAYSELISDGIITRVKGKGSFIRETEIQSHFFQDLSTFEDDMKRVNLMPSTIVLLKEIIDEPSRFHTIFNIETDQEIVHLRFLYKGNGVPMALVDSFLPHQLFPNILEKDFEKFALYQILEADYNHYIAQARRTVDAIVVSDHDAIILNVSKGSAIHEVKTIATDLDEKILEYSCAKYPGDRNSFDIMIYKQ